MQQQEAACDGGYIVYDAQRFSAPPVELFDPYHLSAHGLLSSFASGRGTTWMFRYQDEQYVLRHYHRGGKAGPVLGDRYGWQGKSRTRPAREAALLQMLTAHNIPAALPAAWRVLRSGLFYRADLITVRIVGGISLGQVLRDTPMEASEWMQVGALLRRLHDLQVWHADLNVGNILRRESGEFFLIDLDRSRIRHGGFWKSRNLQRLLRSCRKEQLQGMHFQEADFDALLQGYEDNTK